MARLKEKPRSTSKLRREVQALLKFVPWVLLSLLFVLMAWHADIAALSGLFQSSPVETATAPPPPNTPTPIPTRTPTDMPVAPADATPVITATLTPSPTIEVTLTPTPTLTPTLTPTATPTLSPTDVLTTPATTEPTAPLEADTGWQRYPSDASNVSYQWGMLFDSVALGLSYVWLGCGILIFVTIPVAFAVLWVVSKRRQQPLE
jgi:hypothetical protein